ncbi:hypothetical protein NDU88_002558 [Pleurodeles waltl]|uniref:Uncharacterized protein n=1 Tax=Pleurodeles waltl TaxID=8319 RepID=A0AAV7RCC2_PLEWA|nr:hypothetical protein NDU88_002558 [Pleurodeles waltl]
MAVPYSYFDKNNLNQNSSLTRGREAASQSQQKGARAPQQKDEAARREDQVRQDHTWREFVNAERRAGRRWEEHWGFLKAYDSMGNEKEQEQLPEYIPVFSDKVPNTTNQVIGSRMDTDFGKALMNMEYILLSGNQKKKLGTELVPC